MSVVNVRGVRALALTLVLLTIAFSAQAADRRPPAEPPDVVVLIDPLQKSGEAFRQVIAEAAEYKLAKLGLNAQIASPSAKDNGPPLPIAAASGAPVALVCRYEVNGLEMSVVLRWYDSQNKAITATVQTSGEMDLHLDGVILAALDQILEKVKDRIQALTARKAEPVSAVLPPGRAQTNVSPLEPARGPSMAPRGPAEPPRQSSGARHVLLSGGFAPFLPTGAASYYFGFGYLPTVFAGYLFIIPGGALGVGIMAGMDYFSAVGVTDTASNFLIPLGIDVRYELDAGAFRPFLHVAGGPAVLVMVTGAQGTLTDLLPFLKSGIGLDVSITPWLGICAQADYDVYFEMPYLLTGFSPTLSMSFRL